MDAKNEQNLYWPVYKNLEHEILALADVIHICDDDAKVKYTCDAISDNNVTGKEIEITIKQPQMSVYSVRISDLLFRVCTEIESLIKDLYREERKDDPDSPGKAIIELEHLFLLSKKMINVVAPTFYLQRTENKTFAPFGYSSHDSNDYYSAYNALKHDRVKNINKASIHILMRAMAALYILNIYYRNQKFLVKNDKEIWEFDKSFGSSLFSALIDETYKINTQINKLQGIDVSRFLYVAIYDEKQIEDIIKKTSACNRQALLIARSDIPEVFDEQRIEQLSSCLNIFSLGSFVGEIIINREIEKLPRNDKSAILAFLEDTEFYKEYIKYNPNHIIDKDEDTTIIIKRISSGYYYKKLMHLASAARNISFYTSSMLTLNKLRTLGKLGNTIPISVEEQH